MKQIACSIVLYKNTPEIKKLISLILQEQLDIQLYLVDNSPTDELRSLFTDLPVEYIFNDANLGYGAGHNIVLKKSIEAGTPFHLVLNPDIWFETGTLRHIFNFMCQQPEIGMLMPKVKYENGELQRLCKLLPTPLDLIGRRFFSSTKWGQNRNKRYELVDFDYEHELNTPCLSGCFMFICTSVLQRSGIFDPRYFMYLEDYDLIRRIHRHSRTIFYPKVTVTHGFQKESFKNPELGRIHMQSAIKYFNKWGWIWDKERSAYNKNVLFQIASLDTACKNG